MSERREKGGWQILLGVSFALTVVVALGVYVWGYFAMGTVGSVHLDPGGPATVRVYRAKWQAKAFTPAAKVEALIRGRLVFVEFSDNWVPHEDWEE